MKKALASDFDGTLFFRKHPGFFKQEDLAAIQKFQAEGGLFGVCTGRSVKGIVDGIGDRIPLDFYILVSGALILDRNRQVLMRKVISWELMKELYDMYSEQFMCVIQANDNVYTMTEDVPYQVRIHSLEELKDSYIYGISYATGSVEEAEIVAETIKSRYGEKVSAYRNINYVDVVPAGCSKGNGLNFVKERMHINVMGGIGDSFNDMPMLEEADEPFTFPASPETVRNCAKHIVGSVAEALKIIEAI